MRYKAVVFDLDGTLLDTLDDLWRSTNAALSACGYPERGRDEVRAFVGNGVGRLIALSVPAGTGERETERCLSAFREHYAAHCQDATRPYDGVPELLRELDRRGIKLAIVSNKPDGAVKALSGLYFGALVATAIGETTLVRRKPAPDTVLRALGELGVEQGEALYVGDSEVDIETARNSGLDCVSVSWGFRSKYQLTAAGAGRMIDAPAELLAIV